MSRSCHSATFSSAACAFAADHASQPADLLAGHWIALVRHRRRALLLLAEELLGLADLGALQVANLRCDLVERRRDHRQRGHIKRMPVALDYLRRHSRNIQSKSLADGFLVFRLEMGGIADRTRQLADPHLLRGHLEALDVSHHLGVPVRQFESKRNRLRVNTVGAADLRRVFEFPSTTLQHFRQFREVLADNRRRLLHQQRLRGVDHVVRRKPVVQPPRFGPNLLGDGGGEGDDVVFHLGLDLVDAVDLEAALLANGLGGRLRHHAGFGQRLGGGDFDVQPGLKLVLVTPDAAHLGAGIACDQRELLVLNRSAGDWETLYCTEKPRLSSCAARGPSNHAGRSQRMGKPALPLCSGLIARRRRDTSQPHRSRW